MRVFTMIPFPFFAIPLTLATKKPGGGRGGKVCPLDQFAVPSATAIFPKALEGVGISQVFGVSATWKVDVFAMKKKDPVGCLGLLR